MVRSNSSARVARVYAALEALALGALALALAPAPAALGDPPPFSATGTSPSCGGDPFDNSPTALTVGDFSGHGARDLAVADGAAQALMVLRGDGAGHFTPEQIGFAGALPIAVAAGNLGGVGPG